MRSLWTGAWFIFITVTLVSSLGYFFYKRQKEPLRESPNSILISWGSVIAETKSEFLSYAIDQSQVLQSGWWSQTPPPIPFKDPHFIELTSKLSPAYLRIGGTHSDLVGYLDQKPSSWKESQLNDIAQFSEQTQSKIFFTLNGGPLSKSPQFYDALMQSEFAKKVSLWELGNEPNAFGLHFALKDFVWPSQMAEKLKSLQQHFQISIAGPATAFWPIIGEALTFVWTKYFLKSAGEQIKTITWHYYPQQSPRCGISTRAAELHNMLEPRYLDEILVWSKQIKKWRDQYSPHADIWLGETGNAQCGGQLGISDRFVSSIWWLDQLGLMARENTQVMVRQTLIGGDYGLLDEKLNPRPDYWSSLLWKQLMGTKVLSIQSNQDWPWLRVYAHCHPHNGVTLLAINLHPTDAIQMVISEEQSSSIYKLSGKYLSDEHIYLNGQQLSIENLNSLKGEERITRVEDIEASQILFWHVAQSVPACAGIK